METPGPEPLPSICPKCHRPIQTALQAPSGQACPVCLELLATAETPSRGARALILAAVVYFIIASVFVFEWARKQGFITPEVSDDRYRPRPDPGPSLPVPVRPTPRPPTPVLPAPEPPVSPARARVAPPPSPWDGLWPPPSLKTIEPVCFRIGGQSSFIEFFKDGRALVGTWNNVQVWDLGTGKVQDSISARIGSRDVATPASRAWIAFSADRAIRVLDASSGIQDLPQDLTAWKAIEAKAPFVPRDWSFSLGRSDDAFSWRSVTTPADGRSIAACTGTGLVVVWDTGTHRARSVWSAYGHLEPRVYEPPYDASIATLAFSPDGRTLHAFLKNGALLAYEPSTGKLLRPPVRTDRKNGQMRLSPRGEYAAIVGELPGGLKELCVYETKAMSCLWREGLALAPVTALAFSPDGQTLAVGLSTREAATGKPVRDLGRTGGMPETTAVSPDGQWLVAGDSPGLRLFKLDGGEESAPCRQSLPPVAGVAGARNGCMAVAYGENTIRLFGSAGGGYRELDAYELDEPLQIVHGALWLEMDELIWVARDGVYASRRSSGIRPLARLTPAARRDAPVEVSWCGTAIREVHTGVLEIFTARTGRIKTTWKAHDEPVRLVSPPGDTMVSASAGMVRVWSMDMKGVSLVAQWVPPGRSPRSLLTALRLDGNGFVVGDEAGRVWAVSLGTDARLDPRQPVKLTTRVVSGPRPERGGVTVLGTHIGRSHILAGWQDGTIELIDHDRLAVLGTMRLQGVGAPSYVSSPSAGILLGTSLGRVVTFSVNDLLPPGTVKTDAAGDEGSW